MANETFANKKKKKHWNNSGNKTYWKKKKKFTFDPNIFPPISGFRYWKGKKKNAVTYKCVFSKLVFTSKKEKSKQLHDHHRMAFEVINDFFLKQKEDHFAFWISI